MAGYKTLDGKEIENWDEYLGKLITAFKPALLDSMRVSHLLCLIDIQEVKDQAGVIHQKENNGDYKGATDELLRAIEISDQRGKWQMFLDALKEVEDTHIVQKLLEEKPQDIRLSDDENRHILRIFSYDIQKHLKLSVGMLDKMRQERLILKKDKQMLESLIDRGKREEANNILLLIMHRHSIDWYSTFLGILCDNVHQAGLAELIDEEFCRKRRNLAKESQSDKPPPPPQPSQQVTQKVPEEGGGGVVPPEATPVVQASGGDKATGPKQFSQAQLGDSEASGGDKATAPKQFSQAQRGDSEGQGGKSPDVPVAAEREATCQCQCCAQVLSRVTSLQSELDEMKALLRTLIKQGQE